MFQTVGSFQIFGFGHWDFENLDLFRISVFGFRICRKIAIFTAVCLSHFLTIDPTYVRCIALTGSKRAARVAGYREASKLMIIISITGISTTLRLKAARHTGSKAMPPTV